MEKFLLLRDNKQTGPYSAADLEQMGLKSYDLIWVDGKSAAWRYPGEIDALKSFSPPVTEQPYDRFYKKDAEPDPKEIELLPSNAVAQFSNDISQTGEEKDQLPTNPAPALVEKEQIVAKHIFVSIPKRNDSTDTKKRNTINSNSEEISKREHAEYLPPVSPSERFPDRASRERINENVVALDAKNPFKPTRPSNEFVSGTNEKPLSVNTKRNKGFNPVLLMAAALFLFAFISVFLYTNYKEQNKQLSRLNEIVLNMQQGEVAKPNTPIYNAVAPITNHEDLMIDTSGSSPEHTTTLEKSPEEILPAKKPVTKKTVKSDTVFKEPEATKPIESQPELLINSSGEGRLAKKRGSSDQLKITTNDFKVGFLGGISGLQVTLANNGNFPMEKVDVAVEYLSKENKVVKTQVLTFKNIAAGAALTQDVPRVARGISVRCKIGEAQISESVTSNPEPSGKTP